MLQFSFKIQNSRMETVKKAKKMKNWVVQYVYSTDGGEQGVSISHIEAETYDEARITAIENAVAKEFIFTICLQSDEQVLGTVKHQANIIVGKGVSINPTYE